MEDWAAFPFLEFHEYAYWIQRHYFNIKRVKHEVTSIRRIWYLTEYEIKLRTMTACIRKPQSLVHNLLVLSRKVLWSFWVHFYPLNTNDSSSQVKKMRHSYGGKVAIRHDNSTIRHDNSTIRHDIVRNHICFKSITIFIHSFIDLLILWFNQI